MIASLAVAFIVTPWIALKLLRGHVAKHAAAAVDRAHEPEEGGRFGAFYSGIMTPLIERAGRRYAFYGVTVLLLFGSMGLLAIKAVQVKMLPFDNKSEFQVIADLPEGTTLETSQALGESMAAYLRTVPEVKSTEVYAGTAAPFNFNGLVRHYFMRRGANVVDVQVNLLGKEERDRQSHDIAVAVRPHLDSIAQRFEASVKVAEIPPGPPVMSTLVAEIYGPNDSVRHRGGDARCARSSRRRLAWSTSTGRSRRRRSSARSGSTASSPHGAGPVSSRSRRRSTSPCRGRRWGCRQATRHVKGRRSSRASRWKTARRWRRCSPSRSRR
jgi:multidrug efflux pump subunit AcrB